MLSVGLKGLIRSIILTIGQSSYEVDESEIEFDTMCNSQSTERYKIHLQVIFMNQDFSTVNVAESTRKKLRKKQNPVVQELASTTVLCSIEDYLWIWYLKTISIIGRCPKIPFQSVKRAMFDLTKYLKKKGSHRSQKRGRRGLNQQRHSC